MKPLTESGTTIVVEEQDQPETFVEEPNQPTVSGMGTDAPFPDMQANLMDTNTNNYQTSMLPTVHGESHFRNPTDGFESISMTFDTMEDLGDVEDFSFGSLDSFFGPLANPAPITVCSDHTGIQIRPQQIVLTEPTHGRTIVRPPSAGGIAQGMIAGEPARATRMSIMEHLSPHELRAVHHYTESCSPPLFHSWVEMSPRLCVIISWLRSWNLRFVLHLLWRKVIITGHPS